MNRPTSLRFPTPLARVLGSALVLSGCLTGCINLAPKYERPAAPVAGAFPTVEGTVSSGNPTATEAPSGITWQRFFVDPRLQRLIDLALTNNRDLRVAVLNIEQARAAYQIQRADRLPTVGAGISGNRQSTRGDAPLVSVYQAGLSVTSFELDLFGRVRNLSDAALAQFFATEEARKSTQISLIAQVANVYLTQLADEELLALTQQTLKTREESLRLTRLRFENGVSSRLDLQQAVSLVEQARTTLAQALRQRAEDVNFLTLLVGGPLPADLPPGATLAQTNLPDLPAGLPSDLLAVRPDVRAAEQRLIAANADIGAARANYFPRIALTGTAGTASTELSGLFKSGSYGWTFAPQAILPLFDFGRTRAGVASATAGRDIAVAQYERSIQNAFREVADALAGRGATAAARPASSTCWTRSARCSSRSSRRSRPTCCACRTRSRCTASWAAAGPARRRTRPRRASTDSRHHRPARLKRRQRAGGRFR
jgi:multidrug efflux system outer membrane protein